MQQYRVTCGLIIGSLASTLILLGCASDPASRIQRAPEQRRSVAGVWRLVEYRDYNADGSERDSLGTNAPGLFVYTPEGNMSLHIMTAEDRPAITAETTDEQRGQIYSPYIGYFGTYTVDHERQTITHHIEGAKLPNRIGSAAERAFYFKGDDLVLDFTSGSGRRFYRRLIRIEAF